EVQHQHNRRKHDFLWTLAQKFEDSKRKHLIGKTFREYDATQAGRVSWGEFDRALQAMGFNLHTDDLKQLLQRFDPRKSGLIDYREFTKALFPELEVIGADTSWGHPAGAPDLKQQHEQQFSAYLLPKTDILYQLAQKADLKRKGYLALSREFQRYDADRDGCLRQHEVSAALAEVLGFQLNDKDLQQLGQHFPQYKQTGLIDTQQFAAMLDPAHVNNPPYVAPAAASAAFATVTPYQERDLGMHHTPKTDPLRRLADKIHARGLHQGSVRNVFRSFDANRDGSLTMQEFRNALSHYQLDFSEDEFRFLVQRIDAGGSGLIELDMLTSVLQAIDGPGCQVLFAETGAPRNAASTAPRTPTSAQGIRHGTGMSGSGMGTSPWVSRPGPSRR
ncbi:hypothetical protein CYMTET_30992, partial [Cymbomonas tetramitiformis]